MRDPGRARSAQSSDLAAVVTVLGQAQISPMSSSEKPGLARRMNCRRWASAGRKGGSRQRTRGGLQQALALVEADGVDVHFGGFGEAADGELVCKLWHGEVLGGLVPRVKAWSGLQSQSPVQPSSRKKSPHRGAMGLF